MLLIVLYQHMYPQISKLNSYTLMGILAMSTSLILLWMRLHYTTYIFTTKILWLFSLKSLWKKSNFSDEDKCAHNAKLLIPTPQNFFAKHLLTNPKTCLGNAPFASCQLYDKLLTDNTFGQNKHFAKAYAPLIPDPHKKILIVESMKVVSPVVLRIISLQWSIMAYQSEKIVWKDISLSVLTQSMLKMHQPETIIDIASEIISILLLSANA